MEMICSSLNRLRFMGLGCSHPPLFAHSSRSGFREAGPSNFTAICVSLSWRGGRCRRLGRGCQRRG
jgi:hypothetical protein